MTTWHKLKLWYKQKRHRLLCHFSPTLYAHADLLSSLSSIKQEASRLAAELQISKDRLTKAQQDLSTATLAQLNAIDRASQLALANEQLQTQLSSTVREMADRVERAYAGFVNWCALGGFSSMRAPYPHVPIGDRPEIPANAQSVGQVNRPSARSTVNELSKKILEQVHAKQSQQPPDPILESVFARMERGELYPDAAGNFRNSETHDIIPIVEVETQ